MHHTVMESGVEGERMYSLIAQEVKQHRILPQFHLYLIELNISLTGIVAEYFEHQ